MDKIKIKLTRPSSIMPLRATDGSAGYDVCAAIDTPMRVEQGQITPIPTGVAIELAEGTAALMLGRSGLGCKHGVLMANGVGLIDSDYRGELSAYLTCLKSEGYTIQPQERIAQLVIIPVLTPSLEVADELGDTDRGTGGFGSTGR